MEMMNMDYLNKILRQDEGVMTKIYKDSLGFYTVGIGHLLTKEDNKQKAIEELDKIVGRSTNGEITQSEVDYILELDVKRMMDGILKSGALSPVFNNLDPIRRLGLFSMCFQMGIRGVEGFKNSLALIQKQQWELADSNLRKSAWYRQTPNRANRVINIITKKDLSPYKINV